MAHVLQFGCPDAGCLCSRCPSGLLSRRQQLFGQPPWRNMLASDWALAGCADACRLLRSKTANCGLWWCGLTMQTPAPACAGTLFHPPRGLGARSDAPTPLLPTQLQTRRGATAIIARAPARASSRPRWLTTGARGQVDGIFAIYWDVDRRRGAPSDSPHARRHTVRSEPARPLAARHRADILAAAQPTPRPARAAVRQARRVSARGGSAPRAEDGIVILNRHPRLAVARPLGASSGARPRRGALLLGGRQEGGPRQLRDVRLERARRRAAGAAAAGGR